MLVLLVKQWLCFQNENNYDRGQSTDDDIVDAEKMNNYDDYYEMSSCNLSRMKDKHVNNRKRLVIRRSKL